MSSSRITRLLHLTDPHLYGDESRRIYGVNTASSFRSVLREAMGSGMAPPDAIVVTGDIADDLSAQAYRRFRAALQGLGVPVLCLPGNHDDRTVMAQLLNADGFQYCGQAVLGNWGAVLLDTHVPGEVYGQLAESELVRLDAALREFSEQPVLVLLHHPPIPIDSAWLDGLGLRNARDFLAIIDRHPQVKAVLAGHVHQAFDRLRGRVRVLATPSTCAQFTPRTVDCVMDLRPPGYRWLSLTPDGRMQTEVMWLCDWVVDARPNDDRMGGRRD